MNATLLPGHEVAESLDVNPDTGLSAHEAARRLAANGPNELRSTPPRPAFLRFVDQFRDPLIYLLFVAIGISLVAWGVEGAEGVPIDAVVIAIIVLLNAVIGFVQEQRANDAVAALQQMTSAQTTVWRDGQLVSVPTAEVVRGDIMALSEGDSVGADARVLTSSSLRIQEASLTGESEAVTKGADPLAEEAGIGDRTNMVFKGTAVVQGVGRAVVTATAMDTEMGAIAHMLDTTEEDESPLSREISRISMMLGVAVIVIAAVVMGVLFLINDVNSADDAVRILLLGVSLAVAAVPEGLPAILTVVLAIGVQRLAKRNAVVKELHSVETLGSASVIGSDKTGTLTRNEMTIVTVVTASGSTNVSGTGYEPVGEIESSTPGPEIRHEVAMLLTGGARANNAQLNDGSWTIEGDPTEAAFLVAARKLAGLHDHVDGFERLGEVPFTSDRKMMSTLDRGPSGRMWLMAKGAPDVLLERCFEIQVGDETRELTLGDKRDILGTVTDLSGQALRTLGVAYKLMPDDSADIDESDEHGLVWVGVVGIIDPPRDEAKLAIEDAHRAGIKTIMITGDHPATAWKIAEDLGIADGDGPMSGAELDKMGEAGLESIVENTTVYARVAPDHKRAIVDALQDRGHIVAMTGDGVNDAPALKTADIGVAMGITGTEVTKQAGRMILADDNYATIVTAVQQGRVIFDNIRKFLRFLLSSNMGEVLTVFLGVVLAGVIGLADAGPGVIVPLLATQILWINLVTDTFPALAMGVDPEIDDVMARRPRSLSTPIIDRQMWTTIGLTGFVMAVATLLTLDMFLPGGLIGGSDSLDVARTAAFTTLVFAQLFNTVNSRSETTSAFSHLFTNRWLWGALAVTALLQVAVVHVPFLQRAFSTAPLDAHHWILCILMASLVLWVEELRKIVLRKRVDVW